MVHINSSALWVWECLTQHYSCTAHSWWSLGLTSGFKGCSEQWVGSYGRRLVSLMFSMLVTWTCEEEYDACTSFSGILLCDGLDDGQRAKTWWNQEKQHEAKLFLWLMHDEILRKRIKATEFWPFSQNNNSNDDKELLDAGILRLMSEFWLFFLRIPVFIGC